MRKQAFSAIGTEWELQVFDELSEANWQALLAEIESIATRFDQRYSRFVEDSFVMNLRAGQTYTLTEQDLPLFTLYEQLLAISDGVFTPLVGQLLSQAGYDTTYSLQPGTVGVIPEYHQVLRRQGRQLHVLQDVTLDFGAAGKGYLVDLLAATCESRGMSAYLLDGSGDMRHRQSGQSQTQMGIRVGLEHPFNQQQAIGVVQLHNQSIAGSASNRRRWGAWHHIVHPHRLAPVQAVVATWVVVDQQYPYPTMVADALATALFLVEPKKLATHFPFQYVIYFQNGTVTADPHFTGELFV